MSAFSLSGVKGLLGLLSLAVLGAAAGGCATQSKIVDIKTQAEFDRLIAQSRQPVLVDFYKDSCPTCVLQDAELEDLVDEYGSQVAFVKFKVREATMVSSAPEVMKRYDLFWVPTVILFVNGREKQRWVLNHAAWEFRPELDEATGRGPGRELPEVGQTPPPREGCPIIPGETAPPG